MHQVDEKPMETIHLYVVREEEARPSIAPIILSVFALSLLITLGCLPCQQPEIRTAIRVPAVLLPLKTFSTSVNIVPTGIKTYPATHAQGILTITNGSILSEELSKGMIFTSESGIEVILDAAVFVPSGNASGLGIATVSAHALLSGLQGNLQALAIDQVYGTCLYIRNLQAFTGGEDTHSLQYITAQDRQSALSNARVILAQQIISGLLFHSCAESVTGIISLQVSWICQFVTYQTPPLPKLKILHVLIVGKTVILDVSYIPRSQVFPGK